MWSILHVDFYERYKYLKLLRHARVLSETGAPKALEPIQFPNFLRYILLVQTQIYRKLSLIHCVLFCRTLLFNLAYATHTYCLELFTLTRETIYSRETGRALKNLIGCHEGSN